MPDASIIIPSYKPGEYLYDCLLSIKNQTVKIKQYEIIIVLNGCNEPYYSTIQAYKTDLFGNNSGFRLIQTDIPGVSNARNIGIDVAQGEFLVFVDDDDIISPNYLRCLLDVSSSECVGCSISYSFIDSIDNHSDNFITKAYKRCKNKSFSLFDYRFFLSPPWSKMIHRDIIGELRFPVTLKKSEDSVFCMSISHNIKEMRLASENAIYYQRERQGSAMRTKYSLRSELAFLWQVEKEYIKLFFKHPLKYNVKLLLSRMIACIKNFIAYV